MSIARLGIAVDSSPVRRANADLSQLSKRGGEAERSTRKLAKATDIAYATMARLGRVAGVALAGFATGSVFQGAIRNSEELNRSMLRTNAIIKATGGAAGQSAKKLHDDARALAGATLQNTQGIMRAQQTLLTFRNVQGDVFEGAIRGALDLSSAMGQDLNSSVLQLGKALEDPVLGMTALSRSGTVFTQSQKDLVKDLVAAGNTMQAQKFILQELANQYGGVAAAEAAGLAGAQDMLAQKYEEFSIKLATVLDLLPRATSFYRGAASAIQFLTDNTERLLTIAGVTAAAFGGPLVVSLAAAALGTTTLSGALLFLRGAIIRTGIGVLVVAAGEAVYQFTRLVKGAGSFGDALKLLKNVAIEVFDRITLAAQSLPPAMRAASNNMASWFLLSLRDMSTAYDTFINGARGGLATFAAWMSGGKQSRESILASAGAASNLEGSLLKSAGAYASAGKAGADMSAKIMAKATAPLKSIQALSAAVTQTEDDFEDTGAAVDRVAKKIKDLENSSGGAGSALDGAKAKVDALKDSANDMKSTFRDAFKGLATGAMSMGDAVAGVLNKIADRLLDGVFDGLWDALGGGKSKSGGGFLGDLLGSIFGSANGNVFAGGAHVQAYANGGVVNGPTLFPMNGGRTGLMGEAGPEAIMPLTRIGGKLGVRAMTGGGGSDRVEIVMYAPDGVTMEQVSGKIKVELRNASPAIVQKSVSAVQQANRASKSFLS